MRVRRTSAAAAVLVLGVLLTGCGGSRTDSAADISAPASGSAPATDTGVATGEIPALPGADAGVADQVAGESAASPGAAANARGGRGAGGGGNADAATPGRAPSDRLAIPQAALTGRDVVYTADMAVQVEDVGAAVSEVEAAVATAGGLVTASERSTEPARARRGKAAEDGPEALEQPDRSVAVLTLRIPPGQFESVLDRIARVGEVTARNLTGTDVTDEIVDVRSRITSQRASVIRIRDLMEQAGSLRDVVTLESELSQREADLESLLARQAKLADQTELATVTVRLETAAAAETRVESGEDRGFVAGLNNGWDAFTGALVVAATVLGALVPFLVALLVLGLPALWLVTRMRRSMVATAPQEDTLG